MNNSIFFPVTITLIVFLLISNVFVMSNVMSVKGYQKDIFTEMREMKSEIIKIKSSVKEEGYSEPVKHEESYSECVRKYEFPEYNPCIQDKIDRERQYSKDIMKYYQKIILDCT